MERNKTLSVRGKKKNAAAGGTNFAQENPMHHKARKKKTQKSGTKVDAFVRTESVTSAAEALAETFNSQQSLSKHMTAESTSKKEALPVIQSFESQPQKTMKKTAANNILVVAHPSAQAQQVFELLKASGVQEALPSRREQLSPQALTAILLKSHGLQWQDGQSPAQIEFLQVSSMWQSLVLDLALGNMEQPLWAWMEPQAIHLLDFWAQQNEQTVFMLVYDDIQNIYQQCLQEGEDASPEAINAKVQTWVAYNEALLQFHLRNPERSFLVHAKQVTHSAQSYLQQLNQRIASPVQLQPSLTSYAADSVDVTEVESNPADMHQIASAEKHTDATASVSVDALTSWLMDQLVLMQTDALELYEQLQATANLPLARMNSYQQLAPHAAAEPLKLHQAWSSLVAMHKDYKQSLEQVQILEQTASALQNELNFSQQKNADAQAHHKKLEEENHLALEQLHRVQEELERYHHQKVKLQQELATAQSQAKQLLDAQSEVKKMQDALQAARSEIKQLEGVKNELKLSLQKNANAQAQHKQLEEENRLLLEQLHRVQEELERYHHQKIKLQQELETAQRQAKQLVDAQNEVKKTQDALQAAKSQLKQLEGVQTELKKNQGALQAARSQIKQLEGVQTELKQTKEALQAAQKHKTTVPQELKEENELLLRQLHQVQEELERYFLENKKLKTAGATYKVESSRKSSGASHYGAAERIKNQLSYRLGSIMIEKSRSLGGWFAMPFALRAETQRFRQESAARKGKKLPPIESYADAFEAERVKQHLSYRLGATMIQHSVSLSGWFSMPWALYAQVKEFRKSRR